MTLAKTKGYGLRENFFACPASLHDPDFIEQKTIHPTLTGELAQKTLRRSPTFFVAWALLSKTLTESGFFH